jgi:4-hydroxy-3-polyprenylbenzoate decarboxylase
MKKKRIIVSVTGASGALYAVRLLRFLLLNGFKIELIVSEYGEYTLAEETGLNLKSETLREFLSRKYGENNYSGKVTMHNNNDLAAPLASGNPDILGMVVIPCTMKTLAGIANGYANKLTERAADCMLKERQKLILVPRETPLNLIHIRNMEKITLAGGIIVPAMPAFYQKPDSFDDLGDFIASKVLNLLNIENNLYPHWRE